MVEEKKKKFLNRISNNYTCTKNLLVGMGLKIYCAFSIKQCQ